MNDAALGIERNQLTPTLVKVWDACVALLEMGIKPTPSLINQAMGRLPSNNLNGKETRIRVRLLTEYGYEYVTNGQRWRWEKPNA